MRKRKERKDGMAQSGFHGLIGLGLAKSGHWKMHRSDTESRQSFAFGFVVGNVIPDADLLPLAITYLFDPALAMRMHRTATHSLVVIGLFTLISLALARTRRARYLFLGSALGAVCHSLVDIAVWFSGVDLLWPLSHFGIPSEINLWKGITVPRLVGNLLGAADFLAFGLFSLYLFNLSKTFETDTDFLPRLRIFTAFHFITFSIYLVLAFILSKTLFEMAQYALFVLVSFPITVYAIFRSRKTIQHLVT
ncbi:MAG: metal-dependent hydrolase [Candidatus Fermentithermobacillus carboniphilus]|uniref:Metal-dependent hydrolase n=1 Tax=Candidatus Fermentithermobacillus carboniphilus TaxID=3085328 RepID=A0AAT9LBE0_9FIRM|nr:MAG: metal-dependent hydrolase [Candidatus Fermentithermobacillus carboniphilus]